MKKFEDYITEQEIIFHLCRIRAKYAKNRSKKHLIHLLSLDKEYNYHSNFKHKKRREDKDLEILNDILPHRRKWKKLNKKSRYSRGQRINSLDYNVKSLLITIKHYKKHCPNEPFLKNLNLFIAEITAAINDPKYKINPPNISPRLKGDKKKDYNVCRPISSFNLRDRIIISFTNKYFTEIFDKYFSKKSYAFRAPQIIGTKKVNLTHHDAIEKIIDFKNESKKDCLWVAECDISKFFDSVHHSKVKDLFFRLKRKILKESPEVYDVRAERIFHQYLECYTFIRNVLPYNDPKNKSFWSDKQIPGGSFGWVKSDLERLKYYKNPLRAKIGVPQGGAISGLIANLVLDYADRELAKSFGEDLLYVRFCDDMVLIHSSEEACKKAALIYSNSLKKLKLIPHEFKNDLLNTSDSFWSDKIKSKGPYKWSSNHMTAFPWLGFVGYEIHYDGLLRVRKSSLLKEKKKQKKIVQEIIDGVKNGKRKSNDTIFESAAHRLIGMSVGRITLANYKRVENDMCWVKGFTKLSDNKYLRVQLKGLDKNRNRELSRLLKTLGESIKPKETRKRIAKHSFVQIRGISDIDSALIREELVALGILNKKYQVRPKINLSVDLDLKLSAKYSKYGIEIIRILIESNKGREVPYFGKPFSYYYHVIEKPKIVSI